MPLYYIVQYLYPPLSSCLDTLQYKIRCYPHNPVISSALTWIEENSVT